MLRKFEQMYFNPDEEMGKEMGNVTDKKGIILHLLVNTILLNGGFALVFIEDLGTALFYFLLLSILTLIAIPTIELASYFAVKRIKRKADYWKQLSITNIYLTPVFALFFIGWGFFSWFLPRGIMLPLDFISFPIIMYMNNKKMKAFYGLEGATLPNLVYGIAVIIAYVTWIVAVLVPAIVMGAL